MNTDMDFRNVEWALGETQKDLEKRSFECLCQNCLSSTISSHSQQKEGQLRRIAKDGLVYALNTNIYQHIKNSMQGRSTSILKKVGIGEASTFQGYCAFHDELIFRPIEQKPLIPSDYEQSSLLFLRAISHEYASKRRAVAFHEMLMKKIGPDSNIQFLELLEPLIDGIKLYLTREGPFLLKQIFEVIMTHDYSCIKTSWVRHPQKLPISVTSSVCPWLNNYYEEWSPDKPQAMVAFSIIPNDKYTDVVCSWLDYCNDDSKWIQYEMKSIQGLEKVINLFGIAESEDLCINIDFWESLEENTKQKVIFNIHHSLHRGPTEDVPLIVKLSK